MATPAQVQPNTSTAEREALAQKVAAAFARLADHKEDIERLWQEFANLHEGETIMGCKTKTEFCEKVLGRSIRTVQYLIYGRVREQCSPTQDSPEVKTDDPSTQKPEIAGIVPPTIASGGFWEDLYRRLNALVPSYSDGAEHKTVAMLQQALSEPANTKAEKNFRAYVIDTLNNIAKDFAGYAQQLQNAGVVQVEQPTTSGKMAYQIDHPAPTFEAIC